MLLAECLLKCDSWLRSPEAAVPCFKAALPHSMQISFDRFPFALTFLQASASLFVKESFPHIFSALSCPVQDCSLGSVCAHCP